MPILVVIAIGDQNRFGRRIRLIVPGFEKINESGQRPLYFPGFHIPSSWENPYCQPNTSIHGKKLLEGANICLALITKYATQEIMSRTTRHKIDYDGSWYQLVGNIWTLGRAEFVTYTQEKS
jgi:hypothetical protein